MKRSMKVVSILIFFYSVINSISPSYGFDPLDPHANITIKWDLMQSTSETSDVRISLFNFQLYRHIDHPGWKMSWTWRGDEVIWNMWGAETTDQGNCSRFRGKQLPYCCEKTPVIVDLMPGAPYNLQTANCCKGGVLSSMTQDMSKYGATFQMNVAASTKSSDFVMPQNFTLGLAGYSCGKPFEVSPSKFYTDGGRRRTQALRTLNVTCAYSQFLASSNPTCCVSLSAFYNNTIVPCPKCSCNCQELSHTKCLKSGETPSLIRQNHDPNEEPLPVVICSHHMCPIRVHWHVKQSYREYWRVKMTVTNLNVMKNYSNWNLVVLHPNLQSLVQVFSFNYRALDQYGYINDSGMLWGIREYNDVLLEAGDKGNVQTEMLLHKDPGTFTFREGWAFPRRILFNGDECVMPLPDDYPRLPNTAHSASFTILFSLLLLFIILLFFQM
ncbi:COBRA-like protein 6 isoform X2 [Mangifera indica]|uniref:COBRA-like protein 6 isoform X2 n=1 Tax=Mangifera indica TaxID=29780 RepID=UPI001CF95002|nr:COBRA-like protein 6 isoform X2 [Mangifera indica]